MFKFRSAWSALTFLFTLLLATRVYAQLGPSQDDPVVDVGYAKFRGSVRALDSTIAWYGLRYAAPPAKEQRWRAPLAIESSDYYNNDHVYNATKLAVFCMQGEAGWIPKPFQTSGLDYGVEDCLHLSVFAPSNPVSDKLAVAVQIHGGGWVSGSNLLSDAAFLIGRSRGNMIYVAIQYRIGPLGFLASEEVRKDGVANAGLLDQRAALEWIQRHIAAFGGDPDKVTIMGGSAGATSAVAHMMWKGGQEKPPFRAVMARYPWFQPFHSQDIQELQYKEILRLSSCKDLKCLRGLTYEQLFFAIEKSYVTGYLKLRKYGFGDYYYGPVVDGDIIRGLPTSEIPAGRFAKVPLVTGRNGLEGLMFTNLTLTRDAQVIPDLKRFWPHGTTTFFSKIESLWPASSFWDSNYIARMNMLMNATFVRAMDPKRMFNVLTGNAPFLRRMDIFSSATINCHTYMLASELEKHGLPSWKMIYGTGMLFHGAMDNGVFSGPSPYADPAQADMVRDYLMSFVIEMDPNKRSFDAPNRPDWPRYGQDAAVIDFDFVGARAKFDEDRNERCAFLLENGESLQT